MEIYGYEFPVYSLSLIKWKQKKFTRIKMPVEKPLGMYDGRCPIANAHIREF